MAQPSLQDFSAPFDPTAFAQITQAELLQLVTGATPLVDDKGLVVTTADIGGVPQVPDATTFPKWQNYIWRRVGASAITVYVWNPNAADTPPFEKWVSITLSSIPDGAVTNSKIAPNAVTDDKIAQVAYGKITGLPTSFVPGGAAGGDLSGTYPNPVVAANAINSAKLLSDAAVDANRAVTVNHIKNGAVDPATKILVGTATAKQILNVKDDLSGLQYVTKLITQLAEPVAGDATKSVRVKADASGFEYGPGVVQIQTTPAIAVDTTGTAIPYTTAIPQITDGKEYLTVTITPKKAGNLLLITFNCMVGADGASVHHTTVALFADATANAICVQSSPLLAAADVCPIFLRLLTTAPDTAAHTFRVRFGPSAGNGYMNQSSTTALFGASALLGSSLTVVEIEQN